MVVFNRSSEIPADAVPDLTAQLTKRMAVEPLMVYRHAGKGFVAEMTGQQAATLASNPNIRRVERDRRVSVHGAGTTSSGEDTVQYGADWSLDRIDQRDGNLSGSYAFAHDGSGINIYVIDTGVNENHSNFFTGQVERIHDRFTDEEFDASCVNNDPEPPCPPYEWPCGDDGIHANGVHDEGKRWHGTSVAGKAAAATYGAAQGAYVKDLRAFDCRGISYVSEVNAALDSVAEHAQAHGQAAPLVMSFGFDETTSKVSSIEDSIRALPDNVLPIASAGNSNTLASTQVPARMSGVITVGGTNSSDMRYSNSNYGSAVDIFAPGRDVQTLWGDGDSETITATGTSYAAPLVAGVAAIHASSLNGEIRADNLRQAILGNATEGALGNLEGSPDLLLYQWYQSNDDDDGGGDDDDDDDDEDGGGGDWGGCPYQNEDGEWVMCP
ncbi:S8 family serine peptidase [Natronospira bacteriovora]|uniref:S8 family serine peptidase n=1 Tax=Natronospira bacteriovora TaxID=3069753 RepID=A0ABU0W4C5_9GAMM|nr:S8 family serine peptidase [Natronospira sp. AB-CW4]MDQ2068822.1 S8 family serine peptidase [Natronospira sp. AB-CW4]